LKKACPIVKGYEFSNKWELSDYYRTFPLFMGIRRKLALLSKANCSAINGNFPIFIGIFRFLWEFSAFYGNLKKACPIVNGEIFSNKWELSDFYINFPLFMGIFRFLWEFEESLPYCKKLIVQQ
jgi:hypothetical protein